MNVMKTGTSVTLMLPVPILMDRIHVPAVRDILEMVLCVKVSIHLE